jgi:RecA-family ATPase
MNGDISNNLMLVNDRFTLSECDRWGNFVSHFEILEAMVKQHRPEIIIMDPLSGFYDLSESNNDQNRKFMERLTWIAIRYGISIIMVHHDRKDQTGNPMHTMRGATAFTDWATSVWGLRQSMDEDEKGRETVVSKTDIDFLIEKCRLANGPRPDKIRMTRIEGSSFFQPILDEKLF